MGTTNRKAILLASPGNRDYLPGAKADQVRMKNYLQSARGGGWLPGEIVTRINVSSDELCRLLDGARGVDYLLLYFSGHGCEIGGDRYLRINEYEEISDLSLFRGTVRQLVLCDSCRTGAAIGGIPGIGREYILQDDFWAARAAFDYYIMASPAGQAIIHTTQSGHYAFETGAGGRGTSALLNLTDGWVGQSPSMPVTVVNGQGFMQEWDQLPLEDLVAAVKNGPLAQIYRQVPEVIPVCGNFEVPFGVYSLSPQVGARAIAPARREVNGLVLVGGILLTAWLADQFR